MSHVENCNCIAEQYELPSDIVPDYNFAFWIIRGDNVCKWTTRPKSVPKLKTERSKYRRIAVKFFDLLLRERLYEISFPTIRRKLWLASKKTSNLGKKPVVCLVCSLYRANEAYGFPTTNSPMNDTVFFITDYVKFVYNVNWSKAQRYVEFEHSRITGFNYCLLEELKTIMTENVTEAIFKNREIDLQKIETFLPNLKYLSCRKNDVKEWPRPLTFKKIKTLEIHTEKVDFWRNLACFIRRQKSGFKMIIEGHRSSPFNFDKYLTKYFKYCDLDSPDHCLTLISSSKKSLFEIKK